MTLVIVIAFWLIWPLRAPAMIPTPMNSSTIGMMFLTPHSTMPSELMSGAAVMAWANDRRHGLVPPERIQRGTSDGRRIPPLDGTDQFFTLLRGSQLPIWGLRNHR